MKHTIYIHKKTHKAYRVLGCALYKGRKDKECILYTDEKSYYIRTLKAFARSFKPLKYPL